MKLDLFGCIYIWKDTPHSFDDMTDGVGPKDNEVRFGYLHLYSKRYPTFLYDATSDVRPADNDIRFSGYNCIQKRRFGKLEVMERLSS